MIRNIAEVRFFGDLDINKFTKMLMVSGKLQLAESIVASALYKVVEKKNSRVSGAEKSSRGFKLVCSDY